MKVIALSVALEVASRVALAQGATDPRTHLRACSSMQQAERQECLEKMPRRSEPADRSVQGGDNWVISETTSPVNYTPIVTATTLSRDGSDGSSMQLTIRCRSGRTELVVSGPDVSSGGADHTLSYRVNDGQPVQVGAGPPSFGTGTAFRGDVVPLLLSLPEEGGIAIRLSDRAGSAHIGHFSLSGLNAVRNRVAAACKWPGAVARPRNE